MPHHLTLASPALLLVACAGSPSDAPPSAPEEPGVSGHAFALGGGQVLVAGDAIVVAEPGHDRLAIFRTAPGETWPTLSAIVPLAEGEVPGRMAMDGADRLYVASPPRAACRPST